MAAASDRQPVPQEKLDTFCAGMSRNSLLWASGYLAGLAAGGIPATTASPVAESVRKSDAAEVLHIWYGSQTGNARGVAERLARSAQDAGLQVELASLADVTPRQIRKTKLLTLIVSTHGEGEPPDDAEPLHAYLLSEKTPQLQGLRYAVFALGDSSYEHFCKTGRDFDGALERLGAKRLLEFHEADIDFETVEGEWQPAILKRSAERQSGASPSRPGLQLVAPVVDTPAWSRQHPFAAESLASSPLTVAPSLKSVHHVAVSLDDSGIQYHPGDALGVWPINPPERVNEFLELAGFAADLPVTRGNKEFAAQAWLRDELELTRLSKPFLEQYAKAAGHSGLTDIIGNPDRLRAFLAQHQVNDVLLEFPARLPADVLLDMLRPVTPRLYSIASSPLAFPDEVHLTVRTVGDLKANGRLRTGAASWHLNAHTKPGDALRVFVEPNRHFRLPAENDVPIVMIGAGTGVAPFRAFVDHRRQLGATGDNWLIFGDQRRRTDFLYQLEWLRHLKSGALRKLDVAFSRDQQRKIYVQDCVRAQGRELYGWLERGAHVYVCGAAGGMAAAVEAALLKIIGAHGALDIDASLEYLATLKQQHRYQKDVY